MLAAAKMINDVIKKENYDAVVSINDWLSSIAGIICKNELKIPVVFHVHSTEWGRSGGEGSATVNHLESEMAEKADGIITVSHAIRKI
jgi:glycogen synthase